MALGDLNHDGHLDLVVGNFAATINRVYLGVGDGTFGAGTDIGNVTDDSVSANSLALGDLDGDGNLDLVMGCSEGNFGKINRVYLGKGDGTFKAGKVGGHGLIEVHVVGRTILHLL